MSERYQLVQTAKCLALHDTVDPKVGARYLWILLKVKARHRLKFGGKGQDIASRWFA